MKNNVAFLKEHLNVAWLRPESALWDTIASTILSEHEIISPSLDLGCGNGIFSFITFGGNFSIDYDWYVDVDTDGFWINKDIYNTSLKNNIDQYITKIPKYTFDVGLDHKINLLNLAEQTGLYKKTVLHDANLPLPFEDSQFKTVFSNILYWLDSPATSLQEIYRILKDGGKVMLCIPNTKFNEYCFTYNWARKKSSLLKKLNRGRSANIQQVFSTASFSKLAKNIGFTISHHLTYLSPITLQIWDIGLRPISPILIKMVNKLNVKDRRSIKAEWIDTMLELLTPLYKKDVNSTAEGGFHFFILTKKNNIDNHILLE